MVNDDERREVARRLRRIDAKRLDRVYTMDGEGGECTDPDMAKAGRGLMLGAIAEAIGMHYAPYYFDAAPMRDRLADLIEPSIDRDALLALVDDLMEEAQMADGMSCHMGEAAAYRYCACRIRGLLGVGE